MIDIRITASDATRIIHGLSESGMTLERQIAANRTKIDQIIANDEICLETKATQIDVLNSRIDRDNREIGALKSLMNQIDEERHMVG